MYLSPININYTNSVSFKQRTASRNPNLNLGTSIDDPSWSLPKNVGIDQLGEAACIAQRAKRLYQIAKSEKIIPDVPETYGKRKIYIQGSRTLNNKIIDPESSQNEITVQEISEGYNISYVIHEIGYMNDGDTPDSVEYKFNSNGKLESVTYIEDYYSKLHKGIIDQRFFYEDGKTLRVYEEDVNCQSGIYSQRARIHVEYNNEGVRMKICEDAEVDTQGRLIKARLFARFPLTIASSK